MSTRKPKKFSLKKFVGRLDLPHLRDGGEWRYQMLDNTKFTALEHLISYVKVLRDDYKVPESIIESLIMCLYWDAVMEMGLKQKARDEARAKELLSGIAGLRNDTGRSMTGYEAAIASGQLVRTLPDPTMPEVCPKCGEPPNLAYPCEQCGGQPNLDGDELQ